MLNTVVLASPASPCLSEKCLIYLPSAFNPARKNVDGSEFGQLDHQKLELPRQHLKDPNLLCLSLVLQISKCQKAHAELEEVTLAQNHTPFGDVLLVSCLWRLQACRQGLPCYLFIELCSDSENDASASNDWYLWTLFRCCWTYGGHTWANLSALLLQHGCKHLHCVRLLKRSLGVSAVSHLDEYIHERILHAHSRAKNAGGHAAMYLNLPFSNVWQGLWLSSFYPCNNYMWQVRLKDSNWPNVTLGSFTI